MRYLKKIIIKILYTVNPFILRPPPKLFGPFWGLMQKFVFLDKKGLNIIKKRGLDWIKKFHKIFIFLLKVYVFLNKFL